MCNDTQQFQVEDVMNQIRTKIKENNLRQQRLSYKTYYYYKSIEYLKNQPQIVIFGVGEYGRMIYDELRGNDISGVVCFTDNNQSVVGGQVRGYSILAPDDAVKKYSDCLLYTSDAADD